MVSIKGLELEDQSSTLTPTGAFRASEQVPTNLEELDNSVRDVFVDVVVLFVVY